MADMSAVIEPKSDQLNADDLIAGPMTVTIREVRISPGTEQPVSIFLEGTDKAYRPCKSMSRVLVHGWGADANKYVGRTLTLYRDPDVKWAGIAVGGIRISHMSHIDAGHSLMLTATRGSRKLHKVMPLVMDSRPAAPDAATNWARGFIANVEGFQTVEEIDGFKDSKAAKLVELKGARPDLYEDALAAILKRKGELTVAPPADEPATIMEAVEAGQAGEGGGDPAASKANELIAGIKAAALVMDVDAILSRNELHLAAMEDSIRDTVTMVADARKAELKGASA